MSRVLLGVRGRWCEKSGGCGKRRGQRLQKGHELLLLGRRQPKRLELAVPERRRRSAVVVRDHIGERRELTRVHVRRASSDASQRWRLERTHQLLAVRRGEPKLVTVLGLRVAVAARAVEFPRERLAHANGSAAVDWQRRVRRRHAGIVKMIVRQQRTVVTGAATPDLNAQLPPPAPETVARDPQPWPDRMSLIQDMTALGSNASEQVAVRTELPSGGPVAGSDRFAADPSWIGAAVLPELGRGLV